MGNEELSIKAANIFLRAAAYIRNNGWREKGMGKHGEARCSMGALQSAYSEKIWDRSLAALMYQKLYNRLEGISLTEFNSRHKKGNYVAKLFEDTAKDLYLSKR